MCAPPTPDEIDDLLASVAASEYSSEAVDIVEEWIEKRFGVVGRLTLKDRGEHDYSLHTGPNPDQCYCHVTFPDSPPTGQLSFEPFWFRHLKREAWDNLRAVSELMDSPK